jgi:predicted transcriptional regulator
MNDSRLSTVQQIEKIIRDSSVPISKHKIVDGLSGISVTTVEKYLGDLVRNGSIEKVGKAQKTKYVKK